MAGAAAFALRARARGMSLHLSCGALGVKASQTEAIDYAARFGFDSVDADGRYLGALAADELSRLRDSMKAKHVEWAIAGFPTEFRKDDAAFAESVKALPQFAAGLERAGVKRITTWISPNSEDLTYLQNLRTHARRLREAAGILNDHGLRFGLEYVGTKTLWSARRYPFVHTMAEMKELIAEIGRPNMGFVLDSWHWYTAGEKKQDLLTLRAGEIVSVDLNDAPVGDSGGRADRRQARIAGGDGRNRRGELSGRAAIVGIRRSGARGAIQRCGAQDGSGRRAGGNEKGAR